MHLRTDEYSYDHAANLIEAITDATEICIREGQKKKSEVLPSTDRSMTLSHAHE